ncbi:hypothetical protein [Lonepinella sp. BR2357]|uniref:hypothetical protein n=1 Tax=Lonepinella sp. BR2357 TaxID=3434549 RepID=UPI003F6DFCB4
MYKTKAKDELYFHLSKVIKNVEENGTSAEKFIPVIADYIKLPKDEPVSTERKIEIIQYKYKVFSDD